MRGSPSPFLDSVSDPEHGYILVVVVLFCSLSFYFLTILAVLCLAWFIQLKGLYLENWDERDLLYTCT